MIAWPDFQAGFAALLTRLSGVPANVVNARDDGANYTFPAGAPYPEPGSTDEGQVKVDFSVVSETPWGRDEERTVYDPDAVIEGDTYAGPGAPLGGVVYSVNGRRISETVPEGEVFYFRNVRNKRDDSHEGHKGQRR